jgi:hypothetical protein
MFFKYSFQKNIVYGGLRCEDIIFDGGHVESDDETIHLFYDDTTRHYQVITNVTAAMAKRHVCRGCKGCRCDITQM